MPFDYDKWNRSACACRCILEMIRIGSGRDIPPEQFVLERLGKYPLWKDNPGVTSTMIVCDLVRDLGIANSAEVRRDYAKVVELSNDTQNYAGTLLFFEREFDAKTGKPIPGAHVMLLDGVATAEGFNAFNPLPKGGFDPLKLYPNSWDLLLVHGLVLANV